MDLQQAAFSPVQSENGATSLQQQIHAQLRCGHWLIESGLPPPANHTPKYLLFPDCADARVPDCADARVPDCADARVPDCADALLPNQDIGARQSCACMFALTLTTRLVLAANLGILLIDYLAEQGCITVPLAATALHEIIANGAIHGNLAVDAGASNNWRQLALRQLTMNERCNDNKYGSRLLTIAAAWNHQFLFAAVADQGDGYTPSSAVPPAAPSDLPPPTRAAGRGLMIARAAAEIEVSQGGRCTRMIFNRLADLKDA